MRNVVVMRTLQGETRFLDISRRDCTKNIYINIYMCMNKIRIIIFKRSIDEVACKKSKATMEAWIRPPKLCSPEYTVQNSLHLGEGTVCAIHGTVLLCTFAHAQCTAYSPTQL